MPALSRLSPGRNFSQQQFAAQEILIFTMSTIVSIALSGGCMYQSDVAPAKLPLLNGCCSTSLHLRSLADWLKMPNLHPSVRLSVCLKLRQRCM